MTECAGPSFLVVLIVKPQALLDFSREPFDVELLDRVVMTLYSGSGNEVCCILCKALMAVDLMLCGSDIIATNGTTRVNAIRRASRLLGSCTGYTRAFVIPAVEGEFDNLDLAL